MQALSRGDDDERERRAALTARAKKGVPLKPYFFGQTGDRRENAEVRKLLLRNAANSEKGGPHTSRLSLYLSLSALTHDAALLGGQTTALVSSFPRMESPVRSVETGESGGGGGGGGSGGKDPQQSAGAAGAAAGAQAGTQQHQQSATAGADAFVAKSYLERQVEELSCADEDEAQEKVSKRLQFKQDQAQKKRWVFVPSQLRELENARDEAKT